MNNEIKLSKKEIIGICEFLKIHHFENTYTLLDYITNLQQEKEDYKTRCKKAIKYIKFEWENIIEDECYENHLWSVDGLVIKKLLNILQNGSEKNDNKRSF